MLYKTTFTKYVKYLKSIIKTILIRLNWSIKTDIFAFPHFYCSSHQHRFYFKPSFILSIHNISHVSLSTSEHRYCEVTQFDQSTSDRSNGYRHCHFFSDFVSSWLMGQIRWPHHSFQANQPKMWLQHNSQ